MDFTREFLRESLDDDDATVEDKIVGKSRWSVEHRRVFKHEGKFYESFYSVGATEQQDESPYEYDCDVIACREVVPVEKTVVVYE